MKLTRRKLEIVATAAKLFRKKGYNAVSMRDLAQALEIKAASLYNHINSKQEILGIIILDVAENFTQHMNSVSPENISSIKKLESVIENHIQITIEKTDALACLNNDWMHLEKLDLENYLMMRNTYEAKMRNIIEQGIQQKELQERNIDLVLFSLLSTLRTLHLWYSKNKEVSPQLLFEEMKQNLLHGIIR